jgi:phosphoribosylformimino-5-aminoimidazole carboxamide ribotide isomerase
MKFRPCIDLHNGQVKQIVGSTFSDEAPGAIDTNFTSTRPASWYAEMYKRDGLAGGHVIKLGPGNEEAAAEALEAFPGGFHIGGGISGENALSWLDRGASHVIVTSPAGSRPAGREGAARPRSILPQKGRPLLGRHRPVAEIHRRGGERRQPRASFDIL